uniref:Uncharacterized protein n=1 Tax=Odontella aurita TaxID=265563 RepID=A0A7S4I7S8_9STRA|mmetsp:Transcript_2114/g.5587  ORF Transcript_2114/g.5587 Transcript_2114/m.5587 type:complete len:386 (+) Transcript_2114:107-1264(+)|eukprot:CAMPEP_0113552998 /NCGR_PEP_ID=MMETSP0015_2-20120614/15369_1 /TAXON_ID=2838 /ORGANISM="Odontella" /LENGTH=385 /DNA_ID=CAMNT_0000454019 /DNA_START=74 /DNA_END=1231 /DNA_ORIENTATION=+ /assembly_acc=CAM_ASM_000160
MTSNSRIISAVSAFLAIGSAASATETSIPAGSQIRAGSTLGRHLLAHAHREGGDRALEEGGDWDYSYIANYEIKFQGCHHISQWNGEAEDEDDVRVYTKRLARFRLCPAGSCDNDDSSGCSAKYGDYVVDMGTFLEAWLEAQVDDKEYQCEVYQEKCEEMCDGNDGDDDCEQACYTGYGASYCLDDDNANDNGFDAQDYAECAGFDFGRRRLEDGNGGNNGNNEYFVGPYCADQGGEIRLGLFTDETCTAFSANAFENMAGYELPYSESPGLVGSMCMSCGEQDGEDQDEDGEVDVKEVCEKLYGYAGKCETKMSIDYPNESACTYIEGIKIIREDGVIRTSTTKKSKAAAVCIGLFTTAAVLLGAYVYYLRTKLGRAKINLSSQ